MLIHVKENLPFQEVHETVDELDISEMTSNVSMDWESMLNCFLQFSTIIANCQKNHYCHYCKLSKNLKVITSTISDRSADDSIFLFELGQPFTEPEIDIDNTAVISHDTNVK